MSDKQQFEGTTFDMSPAMHAARLRDLARWARAHGGITDLGQSEILALEAGARALRMLPSLEWAGADQRGERAACPVCSRRVVPHDPRCWLAELLGRSTGQ